MFDQILNIFNHSKYDFRKTANPSDSLSHLFDSWIDYYRLKWSISKSLQPSCILEIGVRYGYSALAFLDSCPHCKYLGIDLDSNTFGGTEGAINWAKKITKSYQADYLIADSQMMTQFPGGVYDFIHIDGQQDGSSSWHDLGIAIQQGRYILVDGYLWTSENFMSINDFLLKHASCFDFYGVIPGYAGELLIKVSNSYLDSCQKDKRSYSSVDLDCYYTKEYYTKDCGGFESYLKNGGQSLEDPRLQSMAAISDNLVAHGHVLDIGCGRGELAYHFANRNFSVTAVDYSSDAIELAHQCFSNNLDLLKRVQLFCDNVCSINLNETYDLAIASDVIEHLSVKEVDTLYQRVSTSLSQDGFFILHTFPNLWYYKYHYKRKWKLAKQIGAYLSAEPRSRYELIMHINEQSPPIMKKQLAKYFNNVLLWFGDVSNPVGSLGEHYSIAMMRQSPSLFAVASHTYIDVHRIIDALEMQVLSDHDASLLKLVILTHEDHLSTTINQILQIPVCLFNQSQVCVNSYSPYPIHLSYHWINESSTETVIFDGERTKLVPILPSNLTNNLKQQNYQLRVKTPESPGNYIIRITLVQEGVRWFDQEFKNLYQDLKITIY
jgi:2-polyprenyl-3-methyl-5-hydroxy-6-metoxy-1,4-benzoquinol methylase